MDIDLFETMNNIDPRSSLHQRDLLEIKNSNETQAFGNSSLKNLKD